MPSFVSLNGIPAAVRGAIFHARFRELLLWCLPALVIGFSARALILYRFPYGYVHPDSADFLITADTFLRHHKFVIHGKKAFLAPVLFALPLLVRMPALLVIPWVQHLFGLIFTLMIGELVRLWTVLWKFWIIPATLLATLNPAMLWYEHTLISEFLYLWCVTALLLAGTLCALRPGKGLFAMLLAALLLTVGARPEGKLYVCFCLLLVLLIRWGGVRTRLIYGGVALAFCLGLWESSHNSAAGVLLYSTVLPLAPEVPKSAPGFAKWIDPLRKQRVDAGPMLPEGLTTTEKTITPLVVGYLKSVGDRKPEYGEFCQKLAVEAALNRPLLLPAIAFNKFLIATIYPPSGDFGPVWMKEKLRESCTYKRWMVRLMPRLAGGELLDESRALDDAGLKQAVLVFIAREFVPLARGATPGSAGTDVFGRLQQGWEGMTTGGRIFEQHYGARTVPGVPVFFMLSAAGMIAGVGRSSPLRRLHIAWVATLGFVFLVVMLTGVMNSRYRFLFEPFCMLYIFVLLDVATGSLIRRKIVHGPAT